MYCARCHSFWLELCFFRLCGSLNFLILEWGCCKLKGSGTCKTHYILECSRQLYNVLSYIWANLFLTNTVSLFQHFLYKGQRKGGKKHHFLRFGYRNHLNLNYIILWNNPWRPRNILQWESMFKNRSLKHNRILSHWRIVLSWLLFWIY